MMFAMDVPYVPVNSVPALIAQAPAPTNGASQQPDYILNACQETELTLNPESAIRGVDPISWVADTVGNREGRAIGYDKRAAAKLSVLETTTHGKLVQKVAPNGHVYFMYEAQEGYYGPDRAVFMVNLEGRYYRTVINLKVVETVDEKSPQCGSATLVKVTKKVSGSSDYYKLNSISVTMGDLLGGAVGQATASSITLDRKAGGFGWYIDPTPQDNTDDYLPTSNPDVWQAKAGSDAAGKMDLLSVLLHEYGHVLGLEHSANSGDYMAATLQPGQRRLPSAEELQLMSELVAQLKGGSTGDQSPTSPLVPSLPSLPLGALLLGCLALGRRPEDRVFDGSQALFAAHPTLQGGGLQNLQDWATQGKVTVASGGTNGANGGATLQEGAASQTRLNQVFTINERRGQKTGSGLAK